MVADMTGLWLFAYIVLPIVVVGLGYLATRAGGRGDHYLKPGA